MVKNVHPALNGKDCKNKWNEKEQARWPEISKLTKQK